MKTFTHLAACIFTLSCMFHSVETSAQSTGNNLPAPGKHLGFSGPQNLEFRTNNSTRMQLMQNGNSNINGFSIDRSGFLELGRNSAFITVGPMSLSEKASDRELI
jgi:hypothetical protein